MSDLYESSETGRKAPREDHDPLCPHDTHPFPATCETCLLIAEVVKRERASIEGPLIDALEFYADPATYHALSIWADPPCGEFMDDFSEDHGDKFYDREMPGKTARAALRGIR